MKIVASAVPDTIAENGELVKTNVKSEKLQTASGQEQADLGRPEPKQIRRYTLDPRKEVGLHDSQPWGVAALREKSEIFQNCSGIGATSMRHQKLLDASRWIVVDTSTYEAGSSRWLTRHTAM